MGEIHKFYAVTINGLAYRVSDEKEHSEPVVRQIADKNLISRDDPDWETSCGRRLTGGYLVGIMTTGIVLYEEDHSPIAADHKRRFRPEEVNIAYYGGQTSALVALFINAAEALACLRSENVQMCDPRWKTETLAVLQLIGDDHPVFVLAKMPELNIKFGLEKQAQAVFLCFATNPCYTIVTSQAPKDVTVFVTDDDWYYRGNCYRIGQARPDLGTRGIIGVYYRNNDRHLEAMIDHATEATRSRVSSLDD